MASAPIRDQLGDHLITPQNAALVVVDYQPSQIEAVRSMDHDLLLKNVVSTVKVAKLFDVPIIHSTINVANGQGPTLPELAAELEDHAPDRPNGDQLVGGRRLPRGRPCHREAQAAHLRSVDRGLHGVPVPGRATGGL